MNLNRVFSAVLPMSLLILQPLARASSTLITGPDTNSTYFPVAGAGGLDSTLNGQSIEIFCVDFANGISWSTDYNANVTSLTSGNLSLTRFGSVTDFTNSYVSDDGTVSLDSTDATTLANTDNSPLARYEMAAYLITTYNQSYVGTGNTPPSSVTAANDGIQQAIWDLLDPVGDSYAPPAVGDPTAALESAAQWYSNPESNKSFLSSFVIISDPSMTTCSTAGGALCGGFQEQLAMLPDPPDPTPEPRGQALIVLAVMLVGSLLARRFAQRTQSGEKTAL